MRKRLTKKQQEAAYAEENAKRDGKPIRGRVKRYSPETIEELWKRAETLHYADPFVVETTFKVKYPALSHDLSADEEAGIFYCGGFEVALHLLATVDYYRKHAAAMEEAVKEAHRLLSEWDWSAIYPISEDMACSAAEAEAVLLAALPQAQGGGEKGDG